MSSDSTTPASPLLTVENLRVSYRTHGGTVPAVRGVSFTVEPGERLALVGESGSGKSTVASVILGLTPPELHVDSGSVLWNGGAGDTGHAGGDRTGHPTDILRARERVLRTVRGRRIGYVPQDPTVSLNPVMRIGEQIAEAVLTHRLAPKAEARRRAVEALATVGIDDPELRARQYPHELSGGMRQRVLIAVALVASPSLLIADEPTSALDVTVQKRILDHLDRLTADRGLASLLITHDLGVAVERADRILVLSRGQIVEAGPAGQVLNHPTHPYTRQLISDAPGLNTVRRVAGPTGDDRQRTPAVTVPRTPPALELRGIVKDFPSGGGTFRAVDGVSLRIDRGTTYGLVGESGSGKTTLGRIALRLEQPTDGRVLLDGTDITGITGGDLRRLRTRIQVVQQNPYATLNPRLTVGENIAEPLAATRTGNRRQRRELARELLEQVALPAELADRRPAGLSGGQRQRVAIARALTVDPEVVILDEPVSALDVSVQAQILDLLVDLQDRRGLSYLFISHDLAVVRDIAHRVGVIRRGHLLEEGPTLDIFGSPTHPYTRELLDAIPGRPAGAGQPGQVVAAAP